MQVSDGPFDDRLVSCELVDFTVQYIHTDFTLNVLGFLVFLAAFLLFIMNSPMALTTVSEWKDLEFVKDYSTQVMLR